ncbi:unnamed protein product [Adineta ricciae]|uniref:Uncharacterized protein n=1 Tax=Adineta ricciae TaxID=249248 RepID=A0A813V6D9_ADIRI|nr:unnamed protein product [Adineta ricciae]
MLFVVVYITIKNTVILSFQSTPPSPSSHLFPFARANALARSAAMTAEFSHSTHTHPSLFLFSCCKDETHQK